MMVSSITEIMGCYSQGVLIFKRNSVLYSNCASCTYVPSSVQVEKLIIK